MVSRASNTKDGKARWNCICDCGKTKLATARLILSGETKSCGCLPCRRREKHHGWKGGRTVLKTGYVMLNVAKAGEKCRSIFEHRYVMEQILGRELKPEEKVHHKNGIRHDNRPENLELWVNAHPDGQRVEDVIEFCVSFLAEYAPEKLQG